MTQSPPPPQLDTKRGFLLGLPIFLVLVVCAILAFLAAGLLGWTGNAQVLIGMCAGPFIGFAVIGLYFMIARPKI